MTFPSPTAWPAWASMWTLAAAIYAACKCLTWQGASVRGVRPWKQVAYLVAWPGLDARAFLETPPPMPARCRSVDWIGAGVNVAAGAALLFGVARALPQKDAYVVGWVGMIGVVLILHFGTFQLLSCAWRRAGVHARPLMNRPLMSATLSDFWGRRWNTAFRDLTHRFLFSPLAARLGPRWAVFIGFLFSGAVHDLVISVPARGGYGGPTVYFAIQGTAMLIERSRFGRRVGLDSGWPGRLFAAAILVSPVGLLFHRPFVVGVIVPFMRVLGAV